jgi:hypothetical protein
LSEATVRTRPRRRTRTGASRVAKAVRIEARAKIAPISAVEAPSSRAKKILKNGAVIPSASPAPASVRASIEMLP